MQPIFPLPTVPNEYYCAIGKVASAWATLETMIDAVLWRLLGTEDQAGACITAQLSGCTPRLRTLRSLLIIRLGNDDLGKKIEAFKRETEKWGGERNRIIHDPLAFDRGSTEMRRLQISAHPKPIFALQETSLEEVHRVLDAICDLIKQFSDLIQDEIKTRLPSSPKTPDEHPPAP